MWPRFLRFSVGLRYGNARKYNYKLITPKFMGKRHATALNHPTLLSCKEAGFVITAKYQRFSFRVPQSIFRLKRTSVCGSCCLFSFNLSMLTGGDHSLKSFLVLAMSYENCHEYLMNRLDVFLHNICLIFCI